MGSQNCDRDPVYILTESSKGGNIAFQYREKGINALKGNAKMMLRKKLRASFKENNKACLCNDNSELINVLDVAGVHLGQDDTRVNDIRRHYPNILTGVSASNKSELQK